MKVALLAASLSVAWFTSAVLLQSRSYRTLKAQGDENGLTPSAHRTGPKGLEGWTLESPIPNDPKGKYSFTLVIARDGRELRRFNGDVFVWKWMFVNDGQTIAYESGPLHFSLSCILADVKTGRELAHYDCNHELPDGAPKWVKALEASQ